MQHFKGKTVIITGSSMGIGKATALEFCKQGAHVVLNGRNEKRLRKTLEEFLQHGYPAIAVQGDITKKTDCEKLVNDTLKKFGRIDVLINNAAMSMRENFENLDPEVFAQLVDSNINGSAFPAWAALPEIKKTKGSIIFISSAAGMVGLPTASAYSVGKMGLTALAQSLKIELSGTDVHIGIVHVGFTRNDDDKMILNAKGDLIPVPKRPAWIQQSKEKVARSVIKTVRRRKFKVTLSAIGKVNELFIRFFPTLALNIIAYSQRRIQRI